MNVLQTLRKPVVTEKSTLMQEQHKYVFEVHPRANKSQVREAVERAFNVNVTAVNITRSAGEQRRFANGRKAYISGKKKAVVTLKQGDTIQIFEGA
ncbi:MAG: 50S ribosomal protein L23 [SAR202 cluster bacterium]|nr:50S ribosomal protein L23 [SAR202 cluster bacterium]